jgi:hypothetical protein
MKVKGLQFAMCDQLQHSYAYAPFNVYVGKLFKKPYDPIMAEGQAVVQLWEVLG